MRVLYGTTKACIDVTSIVLEKCVKKNIAFIPNGDCNRANLFTDPYVGILKSIFIDNGGVSNEYNHTKPIYIDMSNNKIYTDNIPDEIYSIFNTPEHVRIKLENIHKHLKLDFGTFEHEFPEQLMATNYLTGDEKVLEIGANIGRNSLVIAYILNKQNNTNFVTLECDENISKQVIHNRDINNLTFFVEPSALSKRRLIQRGWETIVSDVDVNGYKQVNTITLPQLRDKYKIEFDTLVLDCEGAFYYILLDTPEILDGIKTIIMENDYHNIEHKISVDETLKRNNFYVDYSESGGWGPCYNCFFEVWKRKV
jgi:FkbM family methyltransferase